VIFFKYSFAVNLQYLQDVSFHLNPRFLSVPVVVYNYKVNGVWGSEQRKSVPFPFARGSPFKLHYTCDAPNWYLAVDGVPYLTFRHQINFLLKMKLLICYA
jgi:hypothetical protein